MNYEELALAGIDIQELLDRFMNNGRLVKMIAAKFLTDPTHIQLKEAVEKGDQKAAEFACHSLKGICGNMALKGLFSMLQEQLRLFRSGEYETAAAMTPAILAAYETATCHVARWLEQQ